MEWLFENLGKLAPLAIFLFYLLSSLKGRQEEEAPPDPEAAERSRKIQEEIRRKILERQNEGRAQLGEASVEARQEALQEPEEVEEAEWNRPDFREEARGLQEEVERRVQPRDSEVGAFDVEEYKDAYAEQKREIQEREAEVKALLEDSDLLTAPIAIAPPLRSRSRRSYSAVRSSVKEGLRGPQSLKTSFVIKEVLDRPLGLR